jgi:hypothetical protein
MHKIGIAVAVLLWASSACAEELQYSIPPGWVNLAAGEYVRNAPQFLLDEAKSGKYAVYAVDPAGVTAAGAQVSFNVVEQRTSGVVTRAIALSAVDGVTQAMAGLGAQVDLLETAMMKIGSVPIARTRMYIDAPQLLLRMDQYLIPGRTKSAVLTFVCPPHQYDHYGPIFERTALATRGAYRHGLDWARVFQAGVKWGVVGGVIGLAVGAVAAVKKKGKPAAAPVAAAASTWECPTCRRRVPLRFTECRCGAAKPA